MKVLINFDFCKNQIMNAIVHNLAAAPSSPGEGQLYYDTVLKRLFTWNGTTWVGNDAAAAIMTGADIVTAINASASAIDTDNLAPAIATAVADSHTHSNKAILDASTASVTTAEKTTWNAKEGALPAGGTTSHYLRGDKTWVDFATTVRSAVLTGITFLTNSAILATDTVLVALGKLQSQITALVATSHTHSNKAILDATTYSVTAADHTAWDAKETTTGAQTKATTALNDAKTYTDTSVSALVAAAPGTLDTLNELAAALGDDPNYAASMTALLAAKTNKYAANIGDGTLTVYTITHSLNTLDTVYVLKEVSTGNQVFAEIKNVDANNISVTFAVAPTANQYRIVIVG